MKSIRRTLTIEFCSKSASPQEKELLRKIEHGEPIEILGCTYQGVSIDVSSVSCGSIFGRISNNYKVTLIEKV